MVHCTKVCAQARGAAVSMSAAAVHPSPETLEPCGRRLSSASEAKKTFAGDASGRPGSALARWSDEGDPQRSQFTKFDNSEIARVPAIIAWVSEVCTAIVLGFVISLGFLLVGPFEMAGVTGSAPRDNIACALGYALITTGCAYPIAFCDPMLMTGRWYLYFSAFVFVGFVLVRCVIEQTFGTSALTNCILILAYSAFMPVGPALLRTVAVETSGELAFLPWTWTLTLLKRVRRGEVVMMVILVLVSQAIVFYTW